MKRVTLFAGHYGSGKTNVAINYALHLKSMGLPVKIADLDIVNPYFRTKDSDGVTKSFKSNGQYAEAEDSGTGLKYKEFCPDNFSFEVPADPVG